MLTITTIKDLSPSFKELSKREYMATHILTGICANEEVLNPVVVAVTMADELIEELNKRKIK